MEDLHPDEAICSELRQPAATKLTLQQASVLRDLGAWFESLCNVVALGSTEIWNSACSEKAHSILTI